MILSCIFMFYGADCLVFKPPPEAEADILAEIEKVKRRNLLEQSIDEDDEDGKVEEEELELAEQERNVGKALLWKRRHFFFCCFLIAVFFLVKLEFSYSDSYGDHIILWQIAFTALDILIEQLLTRLIMGEALLSAPLFA